VRTRPATPVLTVVPFMLLLGAQEATITTRVERNGSGLRHVRIVAVPEKREPVRGFANDPKRVNDLLPDMPGRHTRSREVGDEYSWEGDLRFVDASVFGQMRITRREHLSAWPVFRTTYSYSDEVRLTEWAGSEPDLAAGPKTELVYCVTMPGAIDQSSVRPLKDAVIDGDTVTWKLKADQPTQTVTVTSTRPDWAPLVFVALLLLIAILTALRILLRWQRSTPRRI